MRRLIAINGDPESENRVHADDVARQLGFRAGLVPGVDVFEYMVKAVLEDADPGWLSEGDGYGELKLFKPYYDGDEVTISIAPETGHATADDRALLRFSRQPFPNGAPSIPFLELPQDRPQASEVTLAPGTILGSLHKALEHRQLTSLKARELLDLANRILMRNVRLDPWIHTGSVMHLGPGLAELAEVEVRGQVTDLKERKGHGIVTLRVVYLDVQRSQRLAAWIDHSAIWRFR